MTVTADSAIAARPRTTLISLVAIAFLFGAVAGAAGMRSYAYHAAQSSIARGEAKAHTLKRWREKLNLTDDQVAQLSMILDDFNKYYDSVLAEGHERIVQVLTPEQRVKFQKMLQEKY